VILRGPSCGQCYWYKFEDACHFPAASAEERAVLSMIFHGCGTAPSAGLKINFGFCAKIWIGSLHQSLEMSPLIQIFWQEHIIKGHIEMQQEYPYAIQNISTSLQSIPFGHIQYHAIKGVTRLPIIHTLFLAESGTVLAFLGFFASNTSSSFSSVRPFVSTKKK
jgi:hypothetical protein